MVRNRMLSLGLMLVLVVTLLFSGGCIPTEVPEGGEGGFDWTMIIFLVLIFAALYFILIRPQRKRQKEHQQLLGELKRGDRVITTGGIYGEVESVSEDSVVLKVESGTIIRVAKGSVALRREK